jgi:hypothetical protein
MLALPIADSFDLFESLVLLLLTWDFGSFLGALGGFSLGAQWIVLSISSDLLLKLVRPHLIATRDN